MNKLPKILVLATAWFPPKVSGEANILRKIPEYYPAEKIIYLARKLDGAEAFDTTFPSKVYRIKYFTEDTNLISRILGTIEVSYYIKKEGPDVIIVGNGSNAFIAKNALQLIYSKIPYIVLIHGTELLTLEKNGEELSPYIKASRIIANSNYTKDLAADKGIPTGSISVIKPGCDPDKFCQGLNTDNLRKQLKLDGKKVILTVGGLVMRKGQDMIIKSLNKIREAIPNVHYLIAGTGIYAENLRQLCKDMDVSNIVTFLGYVPDDDLPYYYNLCDVFAMPSREALGTVEGLGMVYIEAASCCKPCIGGRGGGMAEAVIDGKTGFIVDSNSSEEIEIALKKILKDENLSKTFGMNGRNMVMEEFSWDYYYKNLIDIVMSFSAK